MANATINTDDEEWRDAPGWAGVYQVSSLGRLKSLPRIAYTSGHPYEEKGCMLSLVPNSIGYVQRTFCQGGRKEQRLVHRLVCEAFHGPPMPGQEAAHGNGVRNDNRASNLRWATRKENFSDKIAHGTAQRGEKNACAKLSNEKVRHIRANSHLPLPVLAKLHQVEVNTVWKVRHRKSWKHID